jgi:hypothetical protein
MQATGIINCHACSLESLELKMREIISFTEIQEPRSDSASVPAKMREERYACKPTKQAIVWRR